MTHEFKLGDKVRVKTEARTVKTAEQRGAPQWLTFGDGSAGWSVRLIRIAVCSRDRRCGIGTRLIERLKDKLLQQRRNRIEVMVDGHSLTAQMFFSACGFHATPMLDDQIRFEFWAQ